MNYKYQSIENQDGVWFAPWFVPLYHYFNYNSVLEYPLKLVYFIGLVDILTYYGVKKRTATAAKTVKYGSEAENISTVRPEQVYMIRTV